MMWSTLKMWACGLTALGLAVGGGVLTSQKTYAQVPAARSKDAKDAEIEALKKEIAALRKQVDDLSKNKPKQEQRKIVATNPVARDVVVTQQYTAKINAQRHINVRALQMGYLEQILVKEGQTVKKDDVLFKIVPVLYKAKLDVEQAEVQIAQLKYQSTKKLFDDKVVTKEEMALAEAERAKARAKAKLAEVELNFTEVRAPFDGLVGRFQEQTGSLVKEGDVLTTLSDNSAMWVYFNVPEKRYLESMANLGQDMAAQQIELVLADGKKFPQTGKLAAIDAKFNSETGTMPFRADFPNPDGLLRHGQSGNVLIHRSLKNVIVIPQRATFSYLGTRHVYVVGKDDVARSRAIDIQYETGDLFVVKNGLDVNDRIVVDGVRQVRDGEKVVYEFRKPEEVMPNPKSQVEK
jgi:membrane fusion protein (multidrug efflux system)